MGAERARLRTLKKTTGGALNGQRGDDSVAADNYVERRCHRGSEVSKEISWEPMLLIDETIVVFGHGSLCCLCTRCWFC